MDVYDIDLIDSWTPNEYKAFIKGAQLRIVDEYDNMARMALFYRVANNKKKLNVQKDLFDAETARKRIENGTDDWKESKEMDTALFEKAQSDLKAWALSMKGGK
ncbi:hypothetical protein [Bacillus sp. JJ722]|uniref:hypothetical protein n=1 Tax=Bacillus sp. JJ722 TaxID=3122973 RepID=UPI002FFFB83C